MTTARKPRLVIPEAPAQPATNPAHARGIRLGAIRIRRDLANEYRRLAMDATRYGDENKAERMHRIADQAEREIERLSREIQEIR